jgi:hypothetical protein
MEVFLVAYTCFHLNFQNYKLKLHQTGNNTVRVHSSLLKTHLRFDDASLMF